MTTNVVAYGREINGNDNDCIKEQSVGQYGQWTNNDENDSDMDVDFERRPKDRMTRVIGRDKWL